MSAKLTRSRAVSDHGNGSKNNTTRKQGCLSCQKPAESAIKWLFFEQIDLFVPNISEIPVNPISAVVYILKMTGKNQENNFQ